MSTFIIGLVCIGIALTGNAGNLMFFLGDSAYSIIRWIGALYVAKIIYEDTPGEMKEPARVLVYGVGAGL